MSYYNRTEGGFFTVAIGATAIPQYARIKIGTDGLAVAAGLTDSGDGILDQAGAANTTGIRARVATAQGTEYGIASGAIASPGLVLYSAAAGAVSTTQGAGAVVVGKSLNAAADTGIVTYLQKTVA